VQVKDSATPGATATASLSITIGSSGTGPTGTVSISGSQTAGQQPTVTVALAGAYTRDITGTLTLTFASAVAAVADDSTIQFLQANSPTGSRAVTFTIPAGSTQATFTSGATHVATGTLAGTITLTTTSFTDSSGAVLTLPTPVTIPIGVSPPVVTKVAITSGTGTFTVNVTGFSPPRDMKSMTFHFVPTTGTTLAQSDVAVDISSQFTAYYNGTTSKSFGSQFTVSVPFNFGGSGFPVAALTVDMTNSQGTSARSAPASP
jgi:hypothetical protein